MEITFEVDGKTRQFRLDTAHSIAIELNFDGEQPNHFGAEKATRQPLESGGFIGSTKGGGSCNVDTLTIIPHCNGTHTETVGHIVDEPVFVGQKLLESLFTAVLVSVSPKNAGITRETYRPRLTASDQVITAESIAEQLEQFDAMSAAAIIIRSLPNDPAKKSLRYGEANPPPFLTVEAIELINRLGFAHLVVDFPSLDRMYDQGMLTNHHLFWNVAEQTHKLSSNSRADKTVTEMVYVPDEMVDGCYLMNLQIPAFGCDAAPSRPILFPMIEDN